MTYKQISEITGVKYRTIQNYLAGDRAIGSEFLAALSEQMGVSATWVLTGEGPMLIPPEAAPEPPIDLDRLRLAIEVVEEGLEAFGRFAPPDVKAGLIVAAYELLQAEGERATAQIIRLIKAA